MTSLSITKRRLGRQSSEEAARAAEVRELIFDRIWTELPEIIESQIRKAKGMWVEKTTLTGQVYTALEPPDLAAAKFLTETVMGLPVKRTEMGGPGSFEAYEDMVHRIAQEKGLIDVTPQIRRPEAREGNPEQMVVSEGPSDPLINEEPQKEELREAVRAGEEGVLHGGVRDPWEAERSAILDRLLRTGIADDDDV